MLCSPVSVLSDVAPPQRERSIAELRMSERAARYKTLVAAPRYEERGRECAPCAYGDCQRSPAEMNGRSEVTVPTIKVMAR